MELTILTSYFCFSKLYFFRGM